MFKTPDQYRITGHPVLGSDKSFGNNGAFAIPIDDDTIAFCIASDGSGWEHVSVTIKESGETETPTWEEMCTIKDLFWDEEDCVIQYHPSRSHYVNHHPNCLHLWRSTTENIKVPDSIYVGIKMKESENGKEDNNV